MRTKSEGVLFFSDFDSGNLERVEFVDTFIATSLEKSPELSGCRFSGGLRASSARPFRPKRCDGSPADVCKQTPHGPAGCTDNTPRQEYFGLSKIKSGTNDPSEVLRKEYRVWTTPDCSDTAFENTNRSWFYFGVESDASVIIRLHVMNLNKQNKLMSQGMTPVFRVLETASQTEVLDQPEVWQRITSKPCYVEAGKNFVLSFEHPVPCGTVTYLAFTYPYSYGQLQRRLSLLDRRHPACLNWRAHDPGGLAEDIYYCRELAIRSVGGQRVDLLTVTSRHGLSDEREAPLAHLFPESLTPKCHIFTGKKVVFVSARVHPGETQASFVLDGLLAFLLSETDPRARALRDLYVFKLMPMLNPDGVLRGHYRTDLAGVNLNRTYLMANWESHPSIFAARSLLLYYHQVYASTAKRVEPTQAVDTVNAFLSNIKHNPVPNSKCQTLAKQQHAFHRRNSNFSKPALPDVNHTFVPTPKYTIFILLNQSIMIFFRNVDNVTFAPQRLPVVLVTGSEGGLAFYVDLHGHASKRGCFLYGNHFQRLQDKVESLLLPKAMAINFAHFDFLGCNFSEQNMYQRDSRDGLSKEGSGRVALFKLTGLLHSYTFECNFNTGRTVNVVASLPTDQSPAKYHPVKGPPKYTPKIFQEAGEALAVSILDLSGTNPLSRLPLTAHGHLTGLRAWITQHLANNGGGDQQALVSPVGGGSIRKVQKPSSWAGVTATALAVTQVLQRRQLSSARGSKTGVAESAVGPLIPACSSRSLRIPVWAPCRALTIPNKDGQQKSETPGYASVKPWVWSKMRAISNTKPCQPIERPLLLANRMRPRRGKDCLQLAKTSDPDSAISVVGRQLRGVSK